MQILFNGIAFKSLYITIDNHSLKCQFHLQIYYINYQCKVTWRFTSNVHFLKHQIHCWCKYWSVSPSVFFVFFLNSKTHNQHILSDDMFTITVQFFMYNVYHHSAVFFMYNFYEFMLLYYSLKYKFQHDMHLNMCTYFGYE